MFERFSRDARSAVVATQEVARSLGDATIRTVHILAGLAGDDLSTGHLLAEHHLERQALLQWLARRQRGGLDESALSALGIDLDAIRTSVEATFGAGALDAEPPPPGRRLFGRRRAADRGHIPFTGEAKKALELSLRETLRLGLDSIEAEAVLLGVLRADDPEVRRVLADFDVDVAALRRAAETRLRRAA